MPWLPLFSQLFHTKNTFAISIVFPIKYGSQRHLDAIFVQESCLEKKMTHRPFRRVFALAQTSSAAWTRKVPGDPKKNSEPWSLLKRPQKVGELNFVSPSPHKTLCYLLSLSLYIYFILFLWGRSKLMQMCLFVCFLCINKGGWCHIIAYKNPCVKHCFCHVWCRFGGVVI